MGKGRGCSRPQRRRAFYAELVDGLLAFAEHHFLLEVKQESGGTLRDEYESIQRQHKTPGWKHPGLEEPPFPAGLAYLLTIGRTEDAHGKLATRIGGWFGELISARQSSGFGINPIGYSEMLAWATLTGREPLPAEIAILRRLDALFLSTMTATSD